MTSRETEDAYYLIVQNFNPGSTEVRLPKGPFAVWYGEYDGTVKGFDMVVLKKSK